MKANTLETYPIQFKDKIDEYLWKEHQILGGCCSSIDSLKYSVAREVVEKLTDIFIEKACSWLKENTYFYVNDYTGSLNEDVLIDEFRTYMKGE